MGKTKEKLFFLAKEARNEQGKQFEITHFFI